MAKMKGKFMTRQEKIDELQNQAQHYRISKEELGKEYEENDIDLYDEVLEPIGFNIVIGVAIMGGVSKTFCG